ncbi:hypothetical protein BH10PSE12_BH10PSE12_33170 [soil metagenome]
MPKAEPPEVTRALYRSIAELEDKRLINAFARRADTATAAMLSSGCNAEFADLAAVNLALPSTIFGTVRNLFERDLSAPEVDVVLRQITLMCIAYVNAAKISASEPDVRESLKR